MNALENVFSVAFYLVRQEYSKFKKLLDCQN
jgi:hypothetical protein